MTSIINAISGLTGTASEIRSELQQTVEISRDATSYSLSGVGDKLATLGVDVAYLIDLRAHIRTLPIGGDTLEGMLLTGGGLAGGVDFTLDAMRFQIAANQQHQSTTVAQQAILSGLLAIGITTGPKWQQRGLESLPTQQEIQDALDSIANQQAKAYLINEIIGPLVNDPTKTVADIKSAVAGA